MLMKNMRECGRTEGANQEIKVKGYTLQDLEE
jgi:hypothetical protein